MYENGRGVPHDNQKAMKYYLESANQGNSDAQNKIGIHSFSFKTLSLDTFTLQGLCIKMEMEYHKIIPKL